MDRREAESFYEEDESVESVAEVFDQGEQGVTREPTRFAWIRDGLLVAGTLGDWAKMWEGDYYAGENDLTTTLITWDGDENTPPQFHKVDVKRGGLTDDDMIPYLFTVPGLHDVAHMSIDGRA